MNLIVSAHINVYRILDIVWTATPKPKVSSHAQQEKFTTKPRARGDPLPHFHNWIRKGAEALPETPSWIFEMRDWSVSIPCNRAFQLPRIADASRCTFVSWFLSLAVYSSAAFRARYPIYWHDLTRIPEGGETTLLDIILYADVTTSLFRIWCSLKNRCT